MKKREQRNAQTEELTEGCNFGVFSKAQSHKVTKRASDTLKKLPKDTFLNKVVGLRY